MMNTDIVTCLASASVAVITVIAFVRSYFNEFREDMNKRFFALENKMDRELDAFETKMDREHDMFRQEHDLFRQALAEQAKRSDHLYQTVIDLLSKKA